MRGCLETNLARAGEPGHRRARVEHRKRRVPESSRVARREDVATGGNRARSADGILVVRQRKREGAAEDGFVDSGRSKDRKKILDHPPREASSAGAPSEVVDHRHAMCRDEAGSGAALDRAPESSRRGDVRFSFQENVEQDVDVEEDLLHRYFVSR